MYRMRLAAAGAVLGLAGCVGIDMDIEVQDDVSARLTGTIQMQRALFDMTNHEGDFCDEAEGGRLELTDAYAFCHFDQTGPFAELLQDDTNDAISATAEALGGGVVRVTIPLDDLDSDLDTMMEDPSTLAMFRPMIEGYEIAFSVTGTEIVSSNGEVSADGRTARLSVPLTAFLDQDLDLPEAFITEVRH